MRRIKAILAVAAAMMLLVVMAVPAMADDLDRACFPFCDGHNNDRHDFDHHDFDHHDFDNEDVDVDVEGPFLVDDELCVFVVTEEEDNDGDGDVDVDDECVDVGDLAFV